MAKIMRWAIGSTLLFLTTAGCTLGAKMDRFTNKFDWQASESAPFNYASYLIGGSLAYHDGSGGLSVPDHRRVDGGWGRGVSGHVVGPDRKPLPNRLAISFFSYTENQFYQGIFELPYDKILRLFKEGYYSPSKANWKTESDNGRTTYSTVIVGVAPGGAVAVWLRGIDKTTEVFFGHAEKVEKDWEIVTRSTSLTREQYIRMVILDSFVTPDGEMIEGPQKEQKQQEALEALLKNGVPFGLWESYRTQYHWQPLFTGMLVEDGLIEDITYFNGESDYLYTPLAPALAATTRPVPKELSYIWMPPNGARGRSMTLNFNEGEIVAAFKKLGSHNQPLQLEMRMVKNDAGHDFTVWLRNDKVAVELKLTTFKIYNIN